MGEDTLIIVDNKPTFIFFAGLPDYWRIANEDLYHHLDVFVCDGIHIPILRRLGLGSGIWRWEGRRRILLKSIWYSFYTCIPFLDKNKVQYAVFTENNPLSFSRRYLQRLRTEYPKLVMLFEFTNVCGKYDNLKRLSHVVSLYDHVITFNKADSERYGFIFQRLCYSFRELDDSAFPETDVLFIGRDKGRLPFLLSVYDRLTELGLSCRFFVANITADKQVVRKGIVYNQWMPYQDVLNYVNHTKCILEVLEDNSNYFSLRTFEALAYRKKLITASADILQFEGYSPSQMLYIKTAEDISRDFFEIPVENKFDSSLVSPVQKLKKYSRLTRTTLQKYNIPN